MYVYMFGNFTYSSVGRIWVLLFSTVLLWSYWDFWEQNWKKGCLWILNVCWRFLLYLGSILDFVVFLHKQNVGKWTGLVGTSLCVFFLYGKCHFLMGVMGWKCEFGKFGFFFPPLHVWKSGNLGKWLKWLECGEIKMSGVWNLPMLVSLGLIMIPNFFFFSKRIFVRVLRWRLTMNQCYIQFIIVGFIKLKAPLQFTRCRPYYDLDNVLNFSLLLYFSFFGIEDFYWDTLYIYIIIDEAERKSN